ncbi:MAG: NifB/NifX family molybdenum-iron cluster-binding protein [bacterium]|nr:NifB/NifX family molybdenum-iron cluster-binding protein [bacterium]
MPRPSKIRRICTEPSYDNFGPIEKSCTGQPKITMTVDEYESIRLIDLEGISQEECAKRMNVARTTAQAIYNSARVKLAECLVNGFELQIAGGNYEICDGNAACFRHSRCHFRAETIKIAEKKENIMRVAVTFENGQIFQHFGKTEEFKIYDVEDKKIVESQVVATKGKGHGALAGFLTENKVDVVICGGIGGGAQDAMKQAGIKLYGGVSGDADDAVKNLLEGTLTFNENIQCSDHHHDHHHDHHEGGCGDHGCGHHE